MISDDYTRIFKPDYTPIEMLNMGVLGGSYYRKVYSRVLKKELRDDIPEYIRKAVSVTNITNPDYDPSRNYYGVKVGLSLPEWEDKGWIHPQNPRGWVEWYVHYYNGLKTPDDIRQIKRWLAFKNRFKALQKRYPNSLKIKQNLLEWGIK